MVQLTVDIAPTRDDHFSRFTVRIAGGISTNAKMITGTTLAVLFAFGIGGVVDHVSANQTQKDDSTQSQPNSGMMGTMGQMTTHHQKISGLMNKLMESMAAIQNEKNPDAFKTNLAEYQKLLDQMSGQMVRQGGTMQMMSGERKQQCPVGLRIVRRPQQNSGLRHDPVSSPKYF